MIAGLRSHLLLALHLHALKIKLQLTEFALFCNLFVHKDDKDARRSLFLGLGLSNPPCILADFGPYVFRMVWRGGSILSLVPSFSGSINDSLRKLVGSTEDCAAASTLAHSSQFEGVIPSLCKSCDKFGESLHGHSTVVLYSSQ